MAERVASTSHETRGRMTRQLVGASLLRQRAVVGLAVAAIAIGASVASALLHVSGDISRRLAHELRALGPNVLVTPATAAGDAADGALGGAAGAFLDAGAAEARIARAGVSGVPVLYAVGRLRGEAVTLVGSDLDRARSLHPQWRIGPGPQPTLVGQRLMSRLGLKRGERVRIALPNGSVVEPVVGASLEAGGADDEALWMPLETLQRATGLEGRVSLFQARVEGGAEAVRTLRPVIEAGGDLRVTGVGSLTAAESQLLERMRRLMALVTLAALAAAGLCAFGTLTDRVLERRRDFALMKALGARRREILTQFAVEAALIGLAGGVVGWLFGLGMAEVIGREVFRTAIAVRWDVPPIVIGLALLVAALSSVAPARLALRVEPAEALKGD